MDYSSEFFFAKDIAYQAGKIMLKHFSSNVKSKMKENITPVTAADIEINNLVIDSILRKYPNHAVIAEEENLHNNRAEFTWICDPLDGTLPYSLSIPTSMFSLALFKGKEPLFGITYDPFLDRLYSSYKNVASMNKEQVLVSKGILKPGDCIGYILMDAHVTDFNNLLNPILKKEIRFMQLHSFVYVAAMVASGKFKGAISVPAYVWDRAASKMILESAGGKMTDENGKEFHTFDVPKMIVMSNGDAHQELVHLVQSSLK